MKARRVDDPAEFLAAAGPLLLADEARHNLILALARTLLDHPGLHPEHRLWVVEADGRPLTAALRTPPHGLVLASTRDIEALGALACTIDDELPAVVGALPEVRVFADAWAAKTGCGRRTRIEQAIYALSAVRPPGPVAGRPRPAAQPDRELLVEWWRAFLVEALHDEDPDLERVGVAVDIRFTTPGWGLTLWEDAGRPVSLAGFGGRTPNGVRIGPVYTPPASRGRGYASALVAAVSAERLAEGRRFCFLYTDLANPVSNRVYERIGYERVCESEEIAFT